MTVHRTITFDAIKPGDKVILTPVIQPGVERRVLVQSVGKGPAAEVGDTGVTYEPRYIEGKNGRLFYRDVVVDEPRGGAHLSSSWSSVRLVIDDEAEALRQDIEQVRRNFPRASPYEYSESLARVLAAAEASLRGADSAALAGRNA